MSADSRSNGQSVNISRPMPGDSQTPFVAQRPGGPKWVGYGCCGKLPWNSNCLLSLPISQIHLFSSKSLKSLDYLSNLCTYCTKSKSVKVVLLDIFNLGNWYSFGFHAGEKMMLRLGQAKYCWSTEKRASVVVFNTRTWTHGKSNTD